MKEKIMKELNEYAEQVISTGNKRKKYECEEARKKKWVKE